MLEIRTGEEPGFAELPEELRVLAQLYVTRVLQPMWVSWSNPVPLRLLQEVDELTSIDLACLVVGDVEIGVESIFVLGDYVLISGESLELDAPSEINSYMFPTSFILEPEILEALIECQDEALWTH